MTNQNWHKQILEIHQALENFQLKEAFDYLHSWIQSLQNWLLEEELNELELTYKAMLSYFSKGVEDTQQDKVYHDLLRSSYKLADGVLLQYQIKNSSSFYFDKKRIFKQHESEHNLKNLSISLDDIIGKQALSSLLENENDLSVSLHKDLETIARQIFDFVWLNDDLDKDEWNILSNLLSNHSNPFSVQCLIVTGLTLGLLENFDANKIELLLETCENSHQEVRQRAIVGLLLVFRKYDKRLYLYPEIDNRLMHLSENKSFVKSVVNIILQFIISKDTEKITRRITEEILPEMMKLNPGLSKKINLNDLISDSGIDEKNPEWKNLIEKSGLNEKLQEFSELQMEGADVMHSSFSHLKSDRFFNEISNWFLPFSLSYSEFLTPSGKQEMNEIVEMIFQSSFLCNSDKYSFYLSLKQMPESVRKMMSGQFTADSMSLSELQKSELPNPEKQVNNIANQYIRDLYRFYKLHPRRTEFEDVFEYGKEFYQSGMIFKLIDDKSYLWIIAEYYFNKNYYKEAAEIFDDLLKKEPDNYVIFQKRGYCKQIAGQIEDALNNYLAAEALHPANSWTLKKIAYCYRILKKPEDALLYYRKVEQLHPDNLSIQLNIGHCFLELKNYKEALNCYFKVEYIDKNGSKAWKPIAWCSFLTGKYSQSLDYYNKILEKNPEGHDYLNIGHTYLAMKNIKQAIDYYVLSVRYWGSFSKFQETLNIDMPDLMTVGVNHTDIPLILDLIKYELNKA